MYLRTSNEELAELLGTIPESQRSVDTQRIEKIIRTTSDRKRDIAQGMLDGEPYWIKMFSPSTKEFRELDFPEQIMEYIAVHFFSNLRRQFSHPIGNYARVVAYREGQSEKEPSVIITRGIKGQCIDNLLQPDRAKPFPKNPKKKTHVDEETQASILLQLVEAYKMAHDQGLLLCDVSWDDMFLENERLMICDGDTVASQEEYLHQIGCFKEGYDPQEFYLNKGGIITPITVMSDKESCALLIYDFFTGAWLNGEISNYERIKRAIQNKKSITYEQKKAIPKKLRPALIPLVEYPRDESITFSDITAAIEEEYKL